MNRALVLAGLVSLWLAWLPCRAALGEEAVPMELYVAPTGDDSGDGTKARPLATLEKARDVIREARKAGRLPAGGATIWLRGGVYALTKGFELAAEDSGAEKAPVVYRACDGEEARLVGGKPLASFKPVTDRAVLDRLDPAARDKVVQCNLKSPANDIPDLGKLSRRGFSIASAPAHLELFYNGKRMTLARWPNEGFTTIAAIPAGSGGGDGHGGTLGGLDAGFHYSGDRPSRWKSVGDVWVHGYWAWDWANSYEAVESIDTGKRLIKTLAPGGIYGFRAGQRFCFLNVLEELDQPGEYYVDRQAGVLYFWPPAEAGQAVVSVVEAPLISLKGVSHVTLRGLTLECTRGHGIVIEGGTGNLVAGCTLRNIGDYAAIVSGGTGHGVVGCDIHDTGDGGVNLSGGDRATLAPGGHAAVNNHIHHVGVWSRCYQPAVMVNGVGLRVAHNLIHDGPHCAILLGGNEHVIEFNEIHSMCLETGDVGAFYMGRDWTMRGNVVRHNFFHHLGGVGMGSMAVYLDDCASGTTVFGNVFYKVTRAAFIGGGRDHAVENNVFVDCTPAVCIDGRGLDKSPVWHDMVYDFMKKRLDEMKPHEPPYSTRYPKLAELDAYYAKPDGVPPEGNVVARNLCVGGQWLQTHWHAQPKMIDVRDNLVGQDPLFVDAAKMNFQLRDDSPAWKLGFRRIPFEEIGLVKDEYRPALPSRR